MEVFVIKNGKFLGKLKETDEKIIFVYENSIEKKAYLLNLPHRENISNKLFPIFENLIPENEIVSNLKHKYSLKSDIEILLYLDNINGSFEFYTEEKFSQLDLKESKVIDYKSIETNILQSEYIYPNILREYSFENVDENKLHPKELDDVVQNTTMGLSGIQYKFAVALDKKNKKVKISKNANDNYFIKPYNKQRTKYIKKGNNDNYLPYLLINEHIFMTLARDFGFKVPYNALIKGDEDYHYIIKRFDKQDDFKIDHIDFLTYMGYLSVSKYDIKVEEIIEKLKSIISPSDFIVLYKFLVFSVIIGHGDLHAKNLSLIYKSNDINEKKLALSPFYDIATTKFYYTTHNDDIGLQVSSTKKSNLKREDLIIIAKKIGLNEEIANKMINDFIYKFFNEFESYIDRLPNEIKALPFYYKSYGSDSFEVILKKYFEKRKQDIMKYLEYEEIKKEPKLDLWK